MTGVRVAGGRQDASAALRALAMPPAWLREAMDAEAVGAALARAVPEVASGALRLEGVGADRLRLMDDDCWKGWYRVRTRDAQDRSQEFVLAATLRRPTPGGTARATGSLGANDWACELPAVGLTLSTSPAVAPQVEPPAVALLLDPERSAALLERALRARGGDRTDLRIVQAKPTVARRKPDRCAVVYTLEYAPGAGEGEWPTMIVAKVHDGDWGEFAYAAMQALWNTPLSHGDAVAIAEPLAFLPEHRVLLQRGIPHEGTLKALLSAALDGGDQARAVSEDQARAVSEDQARAVSEDQARAVSGDQTEGTAVEAALRQTGAGLAALHGCGAADGPAFSLDSRLKEVGELADRFVRLWPPACAAAAPVLRLIASRAAACPAGAPVPSHGSFRPGQVLLDGGRVGFIDFDGFCQSERELDVARFRVTLKSVGLRALPSDASGRARTDRLRRVEHLCRLFTDAYAEQARLDRERLALWEALDLLTNVLNAWAKAKLSRLDATLAVLSAHLEHHGMTASP